MVNIGQSIARAQAIDQRHSIPYRPQYRQITGSVTAAILLQQLAYWWYTSGETPFYKYRAPCKAEKYRAGDSWVEELGFSKDEFDTAIHTIGTKITRGVSKKQSLTGAMGNDPETAASHLVVYWTDSNRATWYQLNTALFGLLVYMAYEKPELLDSSGKTIYLDRLGNTYLLAATGKPIYLSSKTNTETNTDISAASAKTPSSLQVAGNNPLEDFFPREAQEEEPAKKEKIPRTQDPLSLAQFCAQRDTDRVLTSQLSEIFATWLKIALSPEATEDWHRTWLRQVLPKLKTGQPVEPQIAITALQQTLRETRHKDKGAQSNGRYAYCAPDTWLNPKHSKFIECFVTEYRRVLYHQAQEQRAIGGLPPEIASGERIFDEGYIPFG